MDREDSNELSRKILPGTPGGGAEIGGHNDFVELTFEKDVPLGIHVISHGNGLLKVSEFLQGSQAEDVCIAANNDPLKFVGSFIVGINGKEQSSLDKGEFYEQLKDPSRPKKIMFELREANSHVSHGRVIAMEKGESLVELVFRENRPLGIKIKKKGGNGLVLKVEGFPKESQAEAAAKELDIDPDEFMGANIVGVNGRRYEDTEDIYEALKTPARPKAVLFNLDQNRPRRPSRRELLQKAVFATESMRQLSTSIDEMEKMNAEVMVFRERSNSENKEESSPSSRSGAILNNIKGRLSRRNSSTDSESSPSAKSRAIIQGLKNLSIGMRNRSSSRTDSIDSEPELSDRVVFGASVETQPKQVSFIARCEDKISLQDRIEFQSFNESTRFRLLKEEAKGACLKAIQDHLDVFVSENPKVSYEEWIEQLHPENAKSRRNLVRGKSIDHRFYVEESDHRELWNSNLGDGQREFVPTRAYSPVKKDENGTAIQKERAFARSPPQTQQNVESETADENETTEDKEATFIQSPPQTEQSVESETANESETTEDKEQALEQSPQSEQTEESGIVVNKEEALAPSPQTEQNVESGIKAVG